MKRFFVLFVILANTTYGDEVTIGMKGIQSKITGLDGHIDELFAVNIGSVEDFRSGKAGYDGVNFSAPNTVPYEVYFNNGQLAAIDDYVSDHATEVAGVMIGNTEAGATYEGVAPGARLHSVAIADWTDSAQTALAVQNLSRANVFPEMAAINFSFDRPVFMFEDDGKSFLSQFVIGLLADTT